ncbi:cupin domain-containing protein [Marinobacter salicampi]|uniref:cupin domain-containing protein n=1 Tax=Marinobacter salicampi TaxID=435907 RepID=UPI00140864B6|nr:cupin domain-containing protein [Marinobacter salicampi]
MNLTKTIVGSLLTVAIPFAVIAADTPYKGDGHTMITPDELEWGPVGSMSGEAKIAVIEGDLSEEAPFTFRLKLPADYTLDPHIHPAYERVTVLQGTLNFGHGKAFDKDETQELTTGSLAVMAPGEPMFGYTGDEETIIQLHGTGPWGIEYINPEDDPRK